MTKTITSFQEACELLKIDASKLPDVSMLPEDHQAAIIAHYKLVIIAQALNDGWKPNWNDEDEYKYFPYFTVEQNDQRPSGFGLSFHAFGRWHTYTTVGSRLCFKSRELAKYAAEQFTDLYEIYFLYNK